MCYQKCIVTTVGFYAFIRNAPLLTWFLCVRQKCHITDCVFLCVDQKRLVTDCRFLCVDQKCVADCRCLCVVFRNAPRYEKLSLVSDKPNHVDPRALTDFSRRYNKPYQVSHLPTAISLLPSLLAYFTAKLLS